MALNFPDPATQTPVNTWSPTSTPSASTNGLTYLWDGAKWTTEGGVPNLYWTRAGSVLSPTNAGDDVTTTGDVNAANVVATGDVQTTSLNGGPIGGFRNQIINGNLEINQRKVDDLTSDSGFMADRWFKGANVGFRVQHSFTAPPGFTRSFSISGTSDNPMYQSIELPAAGKAGIFSVGSQWTLSCWARCNNGGDIRLGKRFVTGFNDKTDESAQSFTLDANWKRISYTFTIGSAPSATNTALQVQVVGLTANEIFFTGVQLEPGPVATPFEYRLGELALCQRYYHQIDCGAGTYVASGMARNATDNNFPLMLPQKMRALPTISNGGTFIVYRADSGTTVNNIVGYFPDFQTGRLTCTTAGATTAGASTLLYGNANASLSFDAEL